MDQYTGGKWFIGGKDTVRTISCKIWNSTVEYPSWEFKSDIKVSVGNMFNPIFLKMLQGKKQTGRWTIALPALPSFRKRRYVVQMG